MDSYREHPSDFDYAADNQPDREVALTAGGDERRMHVRAYNYWVSLLDGRDFPSIEDLEPEDLNDFSAHSVLLDFTCGRDNPATPYIGAAIREECGLQDEVRTISDVPSRSLLSRLTDHYMQIIANRAPVGFEAEFDNQRGEPICYRGILMPFSSDGDTIDFIYGVINWKHGEVRTSQQVIVPMLDVDDAAEPQAQDLAPDESELVLDVPAQVSRNPLGGFSASIPDIEEPSFPRATKPPEENGSELPVVIADLEEAIEEDAIPAIALSDDAELADRLWAARETAEAVKSADGRSRAALYSALSLAYDFAIAAQSHPDDYAELLQDSGVKAQARAPMTPIVKLVFGIDYDKTRLTEFASALSYAQRVQVSLGGFKSFIETQTGGLKALVAAERQAKRPEARADTKLDAARDRLRAAEPVALADVSIESEFALVVTRRAADGSHEVVALIDDEAMVEKAIRRLA
ncbi:hypothetical protein G7077_08990 [Sphingomonas piscis]|uniref:PAS domain-containing protein n=1 Tax=Sphingomonas piscis TaxID=2714943 RepID=A0A6G7YQJ7_9SPHN|nr:hypothetical protein [Sphingomonas piscis]QIK79009.1 hypothetical protein G7077_08990 [Sphingomonas piscis]